MGEIKCQKMCVYAVIIKTLQEMQRNGNSYKTELTALWDNLMGLEI